MVAMENFEKCTVAMLGGPCSQHVTGNTSRLNQPQSAIITHPSPHFNCSTIEVWEWISNFIPHWTCNCLSLAGITVNPCHLAPEVLWWNTRNSLLIMRKCLPWELMPLTYNGTAQQCCYLFVLTHVLGYWSSSFKIWVQNTGYMEDCKISQQ